MKTAVVYKWARAVTDALVRADGSIDWRNAKMTPGEDDPAALAAAVSVASDADGEVVGVTIGDGDASWALARGIEQAVSVTDAPDVTDNATTAAILAATVRHIDGVDLVLIGDSRQNQGVPVALAGELGWPCLVGLSRVFVQDGQVRATRRVGDELQTVAVPTPIVLAVSADSDVDRAPGMKEMLAARKRPVTKLTLADLGVVATDIVTLGSQRPASTPARVFEGDPAAAAAQLVAALRAEGVL